MSRAKDHDNQAPETTGIWQRETRLVEPAGFVFTLTSGFLRLQRDLSDGRRQIIGFALPGDFVGLGLGARYAYSVDALTDVTVCGFDRLEFSMLAYKTPGLIERLHRSASHELSLAQEHMVLLGRRRAEERVALFLISWRKKLQKHTRLETHWQIRFAPRDLTELSIHPCELHPAHASWPSGRMPCSPWLGGKCSDLSGTERRTRA